MTLSFRIWDIKNKKYIQSCAQAISAKGKLLIGDGYLINSLKEVDPSDYIIEYCTGFKSLNGEDLYVNDYVEYKLGLKMIKGRIVFDNFRFWIYEVCGGCMEFNRHEYKVIGNYNKNSNHI